MANGPGAPRARRTPLQALIYWTLVLGVWGVIFVVGFLAVFAIGLPDTSTLYDVKRQPSISYLDRSGALVAVRGTQESPPVDLDQLPPYVPAAFVAIEDRQFYHHFGFNPWGMARAEIYNVSHHGATLQGGSTITQQLARNLFLSPAQNVRRKAQELILAVWLETKFTKKQILALYLNRVNFGGGAYGIEAASQRYFNKPAKQLTLGEAALLAATMKGPSRYNPAANGDRAARRATQVLNAMVQTGAITPAQRDAAFSAPVRVSATLASQRAQYFTDWLDGQVRTILGKEPTQDLVVETTLDLPIQAAAEQSLRAGVAAHANQGVQQAALVALDGEGRIRAYVGGASYADSQFDRATQAERQAGSSFKPFVYLTAMEAGHTPSEQVVDEPVTINGWSPRNFENKFLGPITLETALAESINTVAARLANEVGTTNVAATAHRLGITSPIQTDPSMALGAVEVTPLEMAEAYDPFGNGGYRIHAYGIERIRTASGQVLYDHSVDKPKPTPVIGQPALSEMVLMMRQVVAAGTGARARIPGYDLAGKTGTTSDYRDAWFVGFTGGFVTAVWCGRDDNTPMKRVTGGGAPAEIWRGFMAPILPHIQAQAIPGGAVAQPAEDLIDKLIEGDQAQPLNPDAPPQAPPPDDGGDPPF
ncbi:MAG TPA: penicillin-binding protein 1A [Caulobacteraceae bacterium]|jgi:penicillin-binding protein 1A|nr:penicillin-binding protein 1A [Caulobacteraceae bacterium]